MALIEGGIRCLALGGGGGEKILVCVEGVVCVFPGLTLVLSDTRWQLITS